MADVLLTHSYHLPYDRKQVRKMQPYPPLGTLYAATGLRAAGISVAVFDTMLCRPGRRFSRCIAASTSRRSSPSMKTISTFVSKMCLTRMRELAWQLSQLAHDAGAMVIAHGSDATDHAEEYLRHGADFVLNGEAERTLADLCARFAAERVQSTGYPGLVNSQCRMARLTQSAVASARNPDWSRPAEAGARTDRSRALPARLDRLRMATSPPMWWPAADAPIAATGAPSRSPATSFKCARPKQVAAEIRELKTAHGAEHIWFGDDVLPSTTTG